MLDRPTGKKPARTVAIRNKRTESIIVFELWSDEQPYGDGAITCAIFRVADLLGLPEFERNRFIQRFRPELKEGDAFRKFIELSYKARSEFEIIPTPIWYENGTREREFRQKLEQMQQSTSFWPGPIRRFSSVRERAVNPPVKPLAKVPVTAQRWYDRFLGR